MKIIWDPNKAKRNFHKHNVRFSDAESVLFDPYALTIEDTTSEDEQALCIYRNGLAGSHINCCFYISRQWNSIDICTPRNKKRKAAL